MLNNLFQKIKDNSSFNSILLAITQSLVAVFFIAIDFFYSKELTVERFGIWKELMLILSMMIPIFSFGIPEGYKYYLAKENQPKQIFANTFSFVLIITILLFAIASVTNLGHFLGWFNIKDYYLLSLFLPLAYFTFVINKTLRYSYIDAGEVPLHTKITLAGFLITAIVLSVVWYRFNTLKSNYLLVGLLLYISLYAIPIGFLIFKNNLTISFKWLNKDYFVKVLKQGIPLYLATFIGVATLNMDKIIVRSFESAEVFAIFSVGALEIPIFAMLSAAFSQNIYPTLVRQINNGNKEDAKELWLDTTKKVSYITYPMILILMFFAEDILYFIYSPEYQDSVILFQTYLLIGLFRNNYYGAIITASGQTKYITLYSSMMLCFNLLFSVSLYYFLGINGVVFGTLASTIFIQFLQLRHEKLVIDYIFKVLLDKKILFLITIIVSLYFLQYFS